MKFSHLEFKGVKGVGSIEVDFTPDKRIHAFIGENGVGKTKLLEALFQSLVLSSKMFKTDLFYPNNHQTFNQPFLDIVFSTMKRDDNLIIENIATIGLKSANPLEQDGNFKFCSDSIIYIGAQNRGFIEDTKEQKESKLGSFNQRKRQYVKSIISAINTDFSSLNMAIDIEHWFIAIAQSSNPFQKQKDNREIEILTVLKLCHQIDNSIDPEFMEIGGDNRVFLKINGVKTQLSHLSTGYASILKIIQSIISGYGYFTNEQQLQNVKGVVFIDEIESHLHLSWQSKIIPTLKELFPNTTFYITTHSPLVLTQLEDGEAYRLQREEDGVVRSNLIHHPNNISYIDLQKRAFDLDLNKIKREQESSDNQKEAKQKLLDLINEEWEKVLIK